MPRKWTAETEWLNDNVIRTVPLSSGRPVTYSDVLQLWCSDERFRSFFVGLLSDSPFSAFRWETPPITNLNADRDFECVLLRCKALDCTVDASPFTDQFSNHAVVTFGNLRGDAILVVPCPGKSDSAYGHLAAFVRRAPESQVHQLWQAVGAAMKKRLGTKPVWLSTAGMGVSWLHVRLDSHPKYYGHSPYRHVH